MRLLAPLLALLLALPAAAEEPVGFLPLAWEDSKHVLSAPARWDDQDWQEVGLASLSVVGTALIIDRPWRDFMRKQDQGSIFWREVEKFGREYAVATMGGLFVAGVLGDETAMAAAQDSMIASMIASGIITTGVKYAVGRARPLHDKGILYAKPFSDPNSSFPSGHSTQAFALASVLAEHYNETWQQTTFYGIASLAALSRTYHDKHYASDILAAGFIGTWVGKSVAAHNRHLHTTDLVLLPAFAPGQTGVQLIGSF